MAAAGMRFETGARQCLIVERVENRFVVAGTEGMKIAIGSVKRARRSAEAEVGHRCAIDAIARAIACQQVFSIASAGIVDVLFGATSQIHRQGDGMGDLVGGQAHGHGCGGGACQGAGLSFVIKSALALPGIDDRLNHVHDVISDGERGDDLLPVELEFFAQRQRGRHQL